MLSKVKSFGLSGLEGFMVTVEVDVSASLPACEIVGLPDAAVARIPRSGCAPP